MPVQWQQGSYTHLYDKVSEKPVPVILHSCFLAHMCTLSETCNHPPVSIPLTMWTTIIVRILTHKDFAGVYIMRVTSNVYYYYYHTMPAGRPAYHDPLQSNHTLCVQVKLSAFQWVFVPINVNQNRWILMAVNVPDRKVHMVDSLPGGGDTTVLCQPWRYVQR